MAECQDFFFMVKKGILLILQMDGRYEVDQSVGFVCLFVLMFTVILVVVNINYKNNYHLQIKRCKKKKKIRRHSSMGVTVWEEEMIGINKMYSLPTLVCDHHNCFFFFFFS